MEYNTVGLGNFRLESGFEVFREQFSELNRQVCGKFGLTMRFKRGFHLSARQFCFSEQPQSLFGEAVGDPSDTLTPFPQRHRSCRQKRHTVVC